MSRTQPSTLISLNKSNHTTKRTKIKRIVPAGGRGGGGRKQSREQKEERRRRRQGRGIDRRHVFGTCV